MDKKNNNSERKTKTRPCIERVILTIMADYKRFLPHMGKL